MSLDIEGENPRVPAGDTRKLPITVTKENGSTFELGGAEIKWKLQDTRTRDVVLSIDDSGVSIVDRIDSEGKFEIKLDTEATIDLEPSDYREKLQIYDSNGNRTTWIGKVYITENG
jgi:hypothetical protein